MASVYKRPGSAVWQCQFYVTDPVSGELRKIRKSTGQTNRKKAAGMAVDMERNAQAVIEAGSDRSQRAKSVLANAVNEIERETFTGPKARKYLAELLTIATGEEMVSYSIESWIAEWYQSKARSSSDATKARYSGHTEAFLNWLGNDRRKKPLESVTSSDARKWRESLQDGVLAGKTVASYMKDLGAVYRAAIREGLVSFNPFSSLEAVDTSDSLPRKPFMLHEVAALIAAAPTNEWRGLILVAAFTGLRLGDSARMIWGSIDLKGERIILIPSKTKKKKREVRIPIQEDLLLYLKSVFHRDLQPNMPVFPELSKLGVGSRSGLSQTFHKIMAAAKVDRGKASRVLEKGKKIAGRVTYERGFHSLRHTFTTWLRNAGVSEEDRMALTGHTTRESHAIYSHEDEATLKAAISKLPSLNPKNP